MKTLYELLKEKEPFSLSCHHDADGIFSATLLKRIFKIKGTVEIPPFNEYKTDVAIDLGYPFNKDWSGVCIDHHPDHPEDRKYSLFWETYPTGLILYKHLREYIPEKDLWLIVGSLAGDGQPELVPDEIWDTFPVLMQGRGVLYKSQYKIGTSGYPLYVFLSSSINGLCRLGFPGQALEVLDSVTNPVELLENVAVRNATDEVRQEEDAIYKYRPIAETYNKFTLIRMRTSKPQVRLAGLLGSKLHGSDNNTTYFVLNETSGEISIRGVMAKYIANRMTAAGWKAGGHAGFCGAHVDPMEIPKLLNFLRMIP